MTEASNPGIADNPDSTPAPAAGRAGIWSLLLILSGAPLAWSVQIAAGYGFAAYACYPKRESLAQPVIAGLHTGLLVLSVAAIIVALLCALLAYRAWRATRDETQGNHHDLLEVGEGRTRFMALCALISSIGFAIALLLTTSVLVLVSPCGL